jgi:hypothetical protein
MHVAESSSFKAKFKRAQTDTASNGKGKFFFYLTRDFDLGKIASRV